MTDITHETAEFIVSYPPVSIDDEARAVVSYRCGRILAGMGDPPGTPLIVALPPILAEMSGSGPAGGNGHGGVREHAVTYAAQAAGALQAAGLEPESTDPLVEVPTLAAALAVGAERGIPGARVLDAVVIGVEVGLRMETALAEYLRRRGWQAGAVAGRMGAAAAAARLLELTTVQAVVALGVATTQIAGLQAAGGTPAGHLAVAKQAADGVEAAFLACAGFTGPADPIGGRRGLAAVAAGYAGSLPSLAAHQGGRWVAGDLPASADPRWAGQGGEGQVRELDSVDDASQLTVTGSSPHR